MNPILSRRFGGACASLLLVLAAPATAALRQEAVEAADQPAEPPAAAPAPEQGAPADAPPSNKALQAVIMKVEGDYARWRPSAEAPWKPAEVDDLLDPGAEIDCGLRTELTLRVGKNATLVVQRMTRLYLPEISEGTDTFHTRVAVLRGKADFQVDKIGLVNDFQVSTPTTTLAVKGTNLRVIHGGFLGTEVEGVATNAMNAITMQYFGRLQASLSGAGTSSQGVPSQVLGALLDTIGPPSGAGTGEVGGGEALALSGGTAPDQTAQNAQNVNNALTTQMAILGGELDPPNSTLPEPGPPPVPPPVIPPPPGGGGGTGTGGGSGGGGTGGGGSAGGSPGGLDSPSNPVVIVPPSSGPQHLPTTGGLTGLGAGDAQLEGATNRPIGGRGPAGAAGLNAHQQFLSNRGMLRPGR